MRLSDLALVALLAYGAFVEAAPAVGAIDGGLAPRHGSPPKYNPPKYAPPPPSRPKKAISACSAADAVVALLRGPLKAQASAFCSSYLHYPVTKLATVSVRSTKTNNLVTTLPDITQTQTTDITNVNLITTITNVYEPDPTATVTTVITAEPSTIIIQKRAIPGQLAAIIPSRISSACSCIVTPSTKTVTQTAFVTDTFNAVSTVGPRTTAVIQTITIQITSSISLTNTLDATNTATVTATETFNPPAVTVTAPRCQQRGTFDGSYPPFRQLGPVFYAGCRIACRNDATCLSSNWLENPNDPQVRGACYLFDKPVKDLFVPKTGGAPQFWNDKACP